MFELKCSAQWFQTNLDSTSVSCIATNGNDIYVGANYKGIYRSSNNGIDWIQLGTELENLTIKTIVFNGTNILAGTNEGVYRSSDNGNSWNAVNNGLTYLNINSLATLNGNIFVCTDMGVYLSVNNGNNWTSINTGLNSSSTEALTVCGNKLFVGTFNGVFVTSNNGSTWNPAGLQSNWIIKITSNSHNIYAVDNNKNIFVSTNYGNSWYQFNTVPLSVYSIFADDNDYVFVASFSGIFITSDNGCSWIESRIQNTAYIYNVIANGIVENNNSIYVSVQNYTEVQNSGIYKRSLMLFVNNATTCAGTPTTLTTTQLLGNDSNTTFLWSNGLTGNSITVNPIETTTYTVFGQTTDGLSDSSQSIVTTLAVPIVEAGNDKSVCEGTSIKLTTEGVYSTTEWNYGVQSNVPFVPDSTSIYIVTASLNDGCTTTDSVHITVRPKPSNPTIRQNGDSLTSDAQYGIQWYLDYNPIPFAHGQSYKATLRGNYYMTVTIDGCSSDTSNNIYHYGYIALFPSLVDNYFTIEAPPQSEIDIFNLQGDKITSLINCEFQTTFDVSNYAQGLYFIRVTTSKRTEVKKFVKE